MRRIPFGKVVSDTGINVDGTSSSASGLAAQSGSATGFVGADVTFSLPPNPFSAIGSPFGTGFSVAVMVLAFSRYCFATRFHVGQRHFADRVNVLIR